MRNLLFLVMLAAVFGGGGLAGAEEPRSATLYKNPQCSCCEGYADYLRENGFEVTVKPTHDLPLMQRQYGVPEPLVGCHTTLIDGYVVEGHVPVNSDPPPYRAPGHQGHLAAGHACGLPGMFGEKAGPFTIYEIGDGPTKVYGVE